MKSRLVNVRLDPEHLRKADRLRKNGISLSDVVREAIDARYGEVTARETRGAADEILAGIFVEFPDPADLPRRAYDVHDAAAARRAMRRRVRRRG